MSIMLDPEPPDSLLKLKEPELKPYESRINSVVAARQINTKITFADQGRSRIRALTKGMLDGNAPYSEAQRRAHGLKWTANLNFMEAEAAVDSARIPYYDLITGAPTLTDCCTKFHPEDPNWTTWNQKITEHFDWLLKQWENFHFNTWNEQYWMLVEGFAVNLFDETGWKWRSLQPSCVKVPMRSHSSLDQRLPYIIVKLVYTLTELWEMIKDEDAATVLGYNVPLMKQCIMRSDNTLGPNAINWRDQPWEEWQRRLRANDVWCGVTGEDVTICHMFLKEFSKPGQKENVSHFMFTEDALGQNDSVGVVPTPDDFLRKNLNKFAEYSEALNVIFQNTADGYWHSVRGMAQKGFKHWDVSNRLKCKTVDNAFLRSSVMLDPGEQTDTDKLQMVVRSDFTVLPAGTKVQQFQAAGDIEGALAVDRMIGNHLANNLGVYNQRTLTREDGRGEQPTATQVQMQATKEAQLSNGQMGLYYLGRDNLYFTAFKKAVACSDEDAMEFKRRCEEDGVPLEALDEMEWVRCNRSSGYGSAQMKKMNLGSLQQIMMLFPEDGKQNFLDDFIAAYGGIDKIDRYNPKIQLPTPDDGWATLENGLMHQGEVPLVLPGQDAVNHLQIHLQDAQQSLAPLQQSIEQDQPDVQGIQAAMPYVKVLIPHCDEHLKALQRDPVYKDIAKTFELQLKQLFSFSGKMYEILRDDQRQQQLQYQQQQQATALGTLDQAKLQSEQQKMALQRYKVQHGEQLKDIEVAGKEKRANLQTAFTIGRDHALARSDIHIDRLKALNDTSTNGES